MNPDEADDTIPALHLGKNSQKANTPSHYNEARVHVLVSES